MSALLKQVWIERPKNSNFFGIVDVEMLKIMSDQSENMIYDVKLIEDHVKVIKIRICS